MPWLLSVFGPSIFHAGLDIWMYGYGPPVLANLRRQNRVRHHANEVLDHIQLPIYPLPDVLPGNVDAARIKGKVSEVVCPWHLDR